MIVGSDHLKDRWLVESSAGWHEDQQEATLIAFRKLVQGSLHVAVDALYSAGSAGDQVEWEEWTVAEDRWRVCMDRF